MAKSNILRNAYIKLDQMPISFGLEPYSEDLADTVIEKRLKVSTIDALRIMHITNMDNIDELSIDCMLLENRIVYYTLCLFRNSSSVYFKFSTAVDGKTVDKTKIPETIQNIMNEYDREYKTHKGTTVSKLWNRGE